MVDEKKYYTARAELKLLEEDIKNGYIGLSVIFLYIVLFRYFILYIYCIKGQVFLYRNRNSFISLVRC